MISRQLLAAEPRDRAVGRGGDDLCAASSRNANCACDGAAGARTESSRRRTLEEARYSSGPRGTPPPVRSSIRLCIRRESSRRSSSRSRGGVSSFSASGWSSRLALGLRMSANTDSSGRRTSTASARASRSTTLGANSCCARRASIFSTCASALLPDARDQRPAPRRTAHRGKGFAPARHAGQRQRRAGAIVELAVEAFVVCRRCRPT